MPRLFLAITAFLTAGIFAAAFVVLLALASYVGLRDLVPPGVAAVITGGATITAMGVVAFLAMVFARGPLTARKNAGVNPDLQAALTLLSTDAASSIKNHPYAAAGTALALGFAIGRNRGLTTMLLDLVLRQDGR